MRHISTLVENETTIADGQAGGSVSASAATRDVGRVKLGGSTVRYTDLLPSSKDTGRVKLGGSTICF